MASFTRPFLLGHAFRIGILLCLNFTFVHGQLPVVNLISNEGFEDFNAQCDEIKDDFCEFYFHGFFKECALPWGNAYGTSAIMDLTYGTSPYSPCVIGGHGPEIGRYFAQVHSNWLEEEDCQREAFFAQLSSPCTLIIDQEYHLSFQARTNNILFDVSSPVDLPNETNDFWLYVATIQGLENVEGGNSGLEGDLICTNLQPTGTGQDLIYSEQGFDTDDEWEVVSFSFTPTGAPNDQILFWGQYESNSNDHGFRNIFFDNFVLTCESQLEPEPDYTQIDHLSFNFTGDIESAISGIEVSEWYWDFGDCISTSNLQNPQHTYMFPGTYEVCLMITDNRCCTQNVCFEVVADPVDLVTTDIFCNDVCFNTEVTPMSAQWNFGDGNSSTEINPCHTYLNTGTYNVTVTFANETCDYTEVIQVVVNYCGGVDYCDVYGMTTPDWVIGDDEDQCSITKASDIWTGIGVVIFQDKIRIDGTLIIDKFVDFVECIVEMGPNAEILVRPNTTFEVNRSIFYSCDYLWRAIRVQPGGNLKLFTNNPSAPTIVSNAWAGVFAHTMSRLDISTTVFDGNMVGIYIPPIPTIPDSPVPISIPNKFMADKFKLDNIRFVGSELLEVAELENCIEQPYPTSNFFTVTPLATSYAGVLMYDVGEELDLSANAVGSSNLYTNMRNGIVAERSNFNVENSRFRDINPSLTGSNYPKNGFGIHAIGQGHTFSQSGFGKDQATTFQNVQRGISVEDYNVLIEDNRMTEGSFVGISVRNSRNRNIAIRDNVIHYAKAGISLFHNDPVNRMEVENNVIQMDHSISSTITHSGIMVTEMNMPPHIEAIIQINEVSDNEAWYGIFVDGSKNINVEENIVNPGSDANFDGISMQYSPAAIVRNNHVNGPGTDGTGLENRGIRMVNSQPSWVLCNKVESLRQGLYFEGTLGASTIARNMFLENLQSGLYYEEMTHTGSQNNMQNEWCGTTSIFGGWEAFHVDANSTNNRYRIDENDGECVIPYPVDPIVDWFVDNDSYSPASACAAYDRDDRQMPDDFDELIATDDITAPEDAPAYIWNLRNALYRHLKFWPDTTWDNSVYEDFLFEMDTSAVGIWYTVEQDIFQHLLPDSAYLDFRSGYEDTLSNAWTALDQFYDDLITSTNPIDSLQAISSIDSVLLALEDYSTYWNATIHRHDSLFNAGLLSLHNSVNSISATEDWTQALKVVNLAYIRWISKLADTLPGNIVTHLETIAASCPQTHGYAVHLALGLLLHAEGYDYHHPDCYTASKPVVSQEILAEQKPNLELIPNPAMDQVMVQLRHTQDGGELLIHHISGKVVLRQTMSNTLTTLSVGNLPSGMYIVQWISDQGAHVSKTLIIQR